MRHSEGTWQFRELPDDVKDDIAVAYWIDTTAGVPICDVKISGASEANARLIAAAPELLEACEAIVRLSEDHGRLNLPEIAGMARAAIRAATGGEQ